MKTLSGLLIVFVIQGAQAQTNDRAYLGCYTDQDDRALPNYLGEGHTPSSCKQAAAAAGQRYAGLQWHGQCWAGGSLRYDHVDDSDCNVPCDADNGYWCGGSYRNSVYDATTHNDSGYLGCYTDQDDRALPNYLGDGHTPSSCKQAAAATGQRYAGLQWHGQCWAGGSIRYDHVDDSECNVLCSADTSFWCGGSYRNSLYDTGGGDTLQGGQSLAPGQFISSGNTMLKYQTDNNLVLYQNGSPIWATYAYLNATADSFRMQVDCNAVVYARYQNLFTGEVSIEYTWASNTYNAGSNCYAKVIPGDWFICAGNTRVWSARGGGSCDEGLSCHVTNYANQQNQTDTTYSLQFPFDYCNQLTGDLPPHCSYYCAWIGDPPMNPAKLDVKILKGTRTVRTGNPVDSCTGTRPQRFTISDVSQPPNSHCWLLTLRDCVQWRPMLPDRCN